MRILPAPLAGQPRYVVREVLIAVWRRWQWPLQSMGLAEWEILAEMAVAPPASPQARRKRMFPGGDPRRTRRRGTLPEPAGALPLSLRERASVSDPMAALRTYRRFAWGISRVGLSRPALART